MATKIKHTRIKEFDSRATQYLLVDGVIWERCWDRWNGAWNHWEEFKVPSEQVDAYWKAMVACKTRDVTDPEYDEAAFEVELA